MSHTLQTQSRVWLYERILTFAAALVCIVVTGWVWGVVSDHQSMWPLPALYLIEAVVITVVVAAVTFRGFTLSSAITQMSAGAMSAFSVLGMFTVGLLYAPIALLLLVAGILSAWRSGQAALAVVAWMVGAAAVQAAVMFALVSLR